jgi:hypothetical protein
MPPPVPWMTRTDRYILDLLDQPGLVMTPKPIWLSLRYLHGDDNAPSKEQIARRLREQLTTHGLVCQPFAGEERAYYTLTDLGERFLHDPDAQPEEFVADVGEY